MRYPSIKESKTQERYEDMQINPCMHDGTSKLAGVIHKFMIHYMETKQKIRSER